jgi:hypothetical protein
VGIRLFEALEPITQRSEVSNPLAIRAADKWSFFIGLEQNDADVPRPNAVNWPPTLTE